MVVARPTLDPITQDVCAFYDDHAVFDDYTGVVVDLEEGKRIAHALGDSKAAILRNHGLLTVGRSVDEAVWWFITMERSCQAQLLAEAAGTPVPIAPEMARLAAEQVGSHRPAGSVSSPCSTASSANSPTCSTDAPPGRSRGDRGTRRRAGGSMSRRGWILFVAMSVIWGCPYLLIRIAVREISPATLIFLRTAPAALVLAPIAVHRGALAGVAARWRWLLAFTAAELALPWLFVGRAEIHLTSSVTGLLVATVPLMATVLYRVLGVEHFDRRRILGLVVGFAGVVTLVGVDLHGTELGPVVEVLVPVVGYAVGPSSSPASSTTWPASG